MKISMPITKKRIQNHFHYAWWMYALLAFIVIFGWNLAGTVTRYQAPAEKRVDWFYGGYHLDEGAAAEALLAKLHTELLPEMEEVNFQQIFMDDAYGEMQLSTWSFAGEGDLYTLNKKYFSNLASNGAMLDLTPYVDSGLLKLDGMDLSDCTVTDPDTGKQWLCGIPAKELPGLLGYNLVCDDCYLSVLINGGNDENTVKLLAWLVDNCRQPADPPAAQQAAQ